MKTHHSNEPIDHNPTKLERYTKQVSLYKALFEKQYPGHPVKSLALMPIHVEYPAPKGWRNGTAEYTSNKNTNQLFLNGKEFRAANPVLEKTIKVNPKELEIKYEDLSDEAKAIAVPVEEKDNTINPDNQRSEDTKPTDWSVATQELIDHMESMGLNVLNETAMQKYFEEHPNAFVQQMVNKRRFSINNRLSEKEKDNIRTILKTINKTGTTLLDDGEGNMYLLDHADKEDIENRKENQDGFNCRLKFSTKDYSEDELKTIKYKIKYGNIRDQRDFNRWASHSLKGQASYNSDSIDAEIRSTNDDNDRLDIQASEGKSIRGLRNSNSSEDFGTGFIRVYGNDGTNGPRYISINKDSGIETFTTPQGEVYGFIDKYNNIYLDRTKISPEHPIHEYTHIWDRVIAKKNPELWQKGVSLMKQTTLWNEILNDSNYGKKWQAIKGISQSQLDNLIASEVHARLVGEGGMELIERLSKRKGQKGIIGKMKEWILDMWKGLMSTFSTWTKEDIDKLTLRDFNRMTMRDFIEGINPLKANEVAARQWDEQHNQQTKQQQSKASYSWAIKSDNGYEVSTAGDKRFSALNATFKPNTTVEGIDVGGQTIENAYQRLFKKSGKGQAPAKGSILDVNQYAGYFEGSAPLQQYASDNSTEAESQPFIL